MDEENAQEIVIRGAITLNVGSVRINVLSKEEYDRTRGEAKGAWYEWQSAAGREFLIKAKIANAGGNRRVAIPATAVLGADTVKDVRILWDRNFRLKRRLLALWVMET